MAETVGAGSMGCEDMAHECLQPDVAALMKVKRLERSAP